MGHYARIVEHDGGLLLARAVDPNKDQSHMLARLAPRHLSRIRFPLGAQTKAETRAEAAAAGLAAAHRAESQEACFSRVTTIARSSTGRGCLQRWARSSTSRRAARRARGYWPFTPWQRRGSASRLGAVPAL